MEECADLQCELAIRDSWLGELFGGFPFHP